MRLRDINKKEFEDFCKESKQDNFFQTKYYAEIMRKEGYHTYFVGLEQDGNIRAAAMLLSKNISLFKKRIFYAPRGVMIDYKNYELLKFFTDSIEKYVKEKHGIYIKINPYLILHDREFDGKLINGGLDNTKSRENLIKLGWLKKDDANDDYENIDDIEPSLLYELELRGKNEQELFSNFSSRLQEIIKKNEIIGITTRKLSKNEFQKFLEILANSSNTTNFLNINYKNYKDILNILEQHNMLDMTIANLNLDKYKEATLKSKNNIKNDAQLEEKINKQLDSIEKLQYKYGHNILLGGIMAVSYHNEYLVLASGDIDQFHNFHVLNTLHWEAIKNAKKLGNEKYNFYGIGNTLEDNPKLSEYQNYHGKVVQLIGEYDYIIHEFAYKKQLKKEKDKNRYK